MTTASLKTGDTKPVKAFAVYADGSQPKTSTMVKRIDPPKRSSPLKRRSEAFGYVSRPSKVPRSAEIAPSQALNGISAAKIEEMVEKKVEEILAARALNEPSKQPF